MHPADCPDWDYKAQANYPHDLEYRASELLRDLRARRVEATNTKNVHRRLFETLTPAQAPYYAGHYRGENFRCLRYYNVIVGAMRGAPSEVVPLSVSELTASLSAAFAALDEAHRLPNAMLPSTEKLKYAVALACSMFCAFLRIHPYADGNGHTARFLVVAIMGRYGFWPRPDAWPIEPRPPDPPYTQLVIDYQAGNLEPLETHLLGCYS